MRYRKPASSSGGDTNRTLSELTRLSAIFLGRVAIREVPATIFRPTLKYGRVKAHRLTAPTLLNAMSRYSLLVFQDADADMLCSQVLGKRQLFLVLALLRNGTDQLFFKQDFAFQRWRQRP